MILFCFLLQIIKDGGKYNEHKLNEVAKLFNLHGEKS